MLCGKCYKKILRGEEIQIEGTIVCKDCASSDLVKKKIVDRCHLCFKLIYKDEIIHEVYENWGTETSEKLMKCQQCYKKWLKVAKLKRKSWKMTRWFDNIFLPFSMWLIITTITINKNKEHVGWAPTLLVFTLTISITILSPFFLDFILFIYQFVYQKILERRYRKLRKEREKMEQKFANLKKKLREKAILEVELHWEENQKNGKVNGKTIAEFLGGGWKSNFDNKGGEEIIKEKDRLIRLIIEAAAKLAKQVKSAPKEDE